MNIEFNDKLNYYLINADEGMVITDWDKKDIETYHYSIRLFCPKHVDVSKFYEITKEENDALMEQHYEAMQKKHNTQKD